MFRCAEAIKLSVRDRGEGSDMSNDTLKQMALDYHRNPVAGKL